MSVCVKVTTLTGLQVSHQLSAQPHMPFSSRLHTSGWQKRGRHSGLFCMETVVFSTRFPLSKLQRDHRKCQISHENWTGKPHDSGKIR